MKTMPARVRALLAFGMFIFSLSASADDTEIYFNIPDSSVRPNLLFVLDNSGSMDAEVATTFSTYDHSQTYSGDYSSNFYYYLGTDDSIKSLKIAVVACDDIKQHLENAGKVIGYKMSYYYQNKWNSFTNVNVNNSTTDCEADNDRAGITWNAISAQDFFTANYANWYVGHRVLTTKTRLEIVQDVANNLADSMRGVNIGLMAFNTDKDQEVCNQWGCDKTVGEGGHVLLSVKNIEENRDAFKTAVSALGPDTNTPLAETLFGAMRYFKGDTPFLDRNPVTSTVSDSKYISPVEYECQANSVIFLTDGEPTMDENNKSTMESVVGACSGNCMDEVAAYMHSNDINALSGEQTVSTYTIGFQTNQALLSDAATKGGGAYYTADDASSLETAFNEIFRDVMATSSTFVAPGVAVNTFNRLNHLDALYFSVFEPDIKPLWAGNLKRYRLAADGTVYDSQGLVAVDPATGFFKAGARSWWGTEDDGPDVDKGGVAKKHADNHADRKVYTFLASANSTDLTTGANAVHMDNIANLPKGMLGDGDMTDAEHEQLLNWIRGARKDDDGTSRKFVSDPLHSVPHLMMTGGTEASPETAVFFGDNQGFLHGIDGETGQTFFSFIPEELLGNQKRLFDNSASDTNRPYGMDGSVVSWVYDHNRNGTIARNEDDHAFIYSGMRRGGRNYYALDVTDLDAPKMLWTIKGGTGDFVELGQSWSKPVKTKIKVNNTVTDVLIFAGGYDEQQDDVNVRTNDSQGRAIFIVNARTGARIWWAGPAGSNADLVLADMKYSIPASPKVLDVTGDGTANQIYVGDMGGQVWRFDINNGSNGSGLVTGAVLADLGGAGVANARRFYHAPDLFGLKFGGSRVLGLVIGSGWQAHPLNNVIDDRIYMLRIPEVTAPPVDDDGIVSYYKLGEDDLYDATENIIQQGVAGAVADAVEESKAEATAELSTKKGWYIRLNRHGNGEKVLSTSQTINNQVFITTYEPEPSNNACAPSAGKARLYHLWVNDGAAVVNYDGLGEDDALTRSDREVELFTQGLPPDPQRMRVDDQDIICVGAECMPVDTLTGVVETYWYEE